MKEWQKKCHHHLCTWHLNKKLKQTNNAGTPVTRDILTRVPLSSHAKGLRCIVPICRRVWPGDGAVSSLDSPPGQTVPLYMLSETAPTSANF